MSKIYLAAHSAPLRYTGPPPQLMVLNLLLGIVESSSNVMILKIFSNLGLLTLHKFLILTGELLVF